MTRIRTVALVPAALLLLVGGSLAGCAPEPSPTPTAEQTTSTPTPTATTGRTSTPTPMTSTQPSAPPAAFTTDELVQICIDVTTSAYDTDVVFEPAGARIEKRTVTPEWLVLVPAKTNGYDAESVCTIGGSPSDPDVELSSASVQPLPEEQIQRLIRGENEGGTE
ncbi:MULTISPECIES: hypothetical protein [unclassified Microbacterium]|uniref:hypothetical protein n=1 Tax=unclassified Microbacterium TaxID=2609290 RepID=UPI001DD6AB90|nr:MULTISPECIES: hypothetical protein [unclassified Microbacterium]CAH0203030.1 hypothetical protein SRABI121_02536 [Microbacterium sp. Bi121]HWK78500.1 hypothetical protein [Microbacterium sp.]